jgi:hypothetical protein
MNLAEAVEIAGTSARLPVPDDAEDLLKQVAGGGVVPAGRSLSLACAPRGLIVRPAEALHLLSLVARHAYQDGDLHDAYAWWGLLRYLGFFDHDTSDPENPVLRVSRTGRRVMGVQRRVASEELGIAFGVLVASLHFREELGPGVPVGIIDADLLLHGSGCGSSRRPDYMLVAGLAGDSSHNSMRFLECKGTSDPRDSGGQLTTAVGQVATPIFGISAPGLMVSTVTGSKQVSYVALELTGGKDINESCDFGKSPRHRERATRGLDMGRELIPAALRSSWFMLGHYAGNQAAMQNWSDSEGKRVGAIPDYLGKRTQIESEHGLAIGITKTFDLGDRQLIVTWAIDKGVDDALTRGDPSDVIAAQEAFAANLDGPNPGDEAGYDPEARACDVPSPPATGAQAVPGEHVESQMPDGSIFSLTVR